MISNCHNFAYNFTMNLCHLLYCYILEGHHSRSSNLLTEYLVPTSKFHHFFFPHRCFFFSLLYKILVFIIDQVHDISSARTLSGLSKHIINLPKIQFTHDLWELVEYLIYLAVFFTNCFIYECSISQRNYKLLDVEWSVPGFYSPLSLEQDYIVKTAY